MIGESSVWRVEGGWAGGHRCAVVQGVSVSGGDHQPLCLAVLPVSAQLAGGRGDDAERGVTVSHETIRQWTGKFGQAYASGLRRRRPHPGDKWHLDEVFITINGKTHYLWRAVDQDGNVLDILVPPRRDATAATRFFRKLLTRWQTVPRVLVTDKLASYGVARRGLMTGVEHRRSKYLNNRAENSHQPTRQRERAMKNSLHPVARSGSCPRSVGYHRTFDLVAT